MSGIEVEVRSEPSGIEPHWQALVERSGLNANVFMHPAAIAAAVETGFSRVRLLLAWQGTDAARRLVGLWALQTSRLAPFWPLFLAAPAYEYAFLSSPLIDTAYMATVARAFFDKIASDPALPKVVRLRHLDGDAESYRAIRKALAARGGEVLELAQRERPFATREAAQKRSGSTRKKLRQDWNRLSAHGAVEVTNDRDAAAVASAFETFLTLEAASWKGERGTALLSKEADAAFARQFVGNLARAGAASVALLKCDGKAIAAQVVLYCGATAYTWKTAFDAAYAKYSPGALLVDKITDQLFAEGIEAIDSCSMEDGFMARLWTGRRLNIDLLADVRPKAGLSFAISALGEHGYVGLRRLRDKFQAARASLLNRRPPSPSEPAARPSA